MSFRSLLKPGVIDTFQSGYNAKQFRNDVFGGITASIVALPLALAFGVASGAGPSAGLYGAIATGFFASLFGGTPVQVSGPTGPMTVVMGAVVASHSDSLPEAFTIVMLGGLIQMVFGFLRVGGYVAYTPVSVVSGFMSGIGMIIMIMQAPLFLGLADAGDGVAGALKALATLDAALVDVHAMILAAAMLLLLVFWPARIARVVPAPLGALVVGTGITALALPNLSVIGAIPSSIPSLVSPQFAVANAAQMLQPAFILALLGSVDSLLTSLVADSLTKTQHDSDKELAGQGLGNLVAGLFGAIPGAGATMRTVVNIRAGGRTAVSGIVHALVLLGFALGLGPMVGFVPHAALAAILMKVGWDIVDWGYWKRLRRVPREKAVVMLVTFGLTLFVDLITAVAVGIIFASFVNARWMAEEQLKGLKQSFGEDDTDLLTAEEKATLRQVPGRILVTLLHGSFSYASARELARRDNQSTTDLDAVIYDFSHSGYVDPSAALAIDEMVELSIRHERHVILAGLKDSALKVLGAVGVLDRIPVEQQFELRKDAIEAAVDHCLSLKSHTILPTNPNEVSTK